MICVGARFGTLNVEAVIGGSKGFHPVATCRCDCGERRTVRCTNLRTRRVSRCAKCSRSAAWAGRTRTSEAEQSLLAAESDYRCRARRRGHVWDLDRGTFRALISSDCNYCSEPHAGGVDRADNTEGYTRHNSVPCCSTCNYAKRDMTVENFLNWAARVAKRNPA